MKTFIDKLREYPIEMLENAIKYQKKEIEIAKRDLETMKRVMDERTRNSKETNGHILHPIKL